MQTGHLSFHIMEDMDLGICIRQTKVPCGLFLYYFLFFSIEGMPTLLERKVPVA
jgi:hypothetical protein